MYDRRAETDPVHLPPSGPSTYTAECSRLMSTIAVQRAVTGLVLMPTSTTPAVTRP